MARTTPARDRLPLQPLVPNHIDPLPEDFSRLKQEIIKSIKTNLPNWFVISISDDKLEVGSIVQNITFFLSFDLT